MWWILKTAMWYKNTGNRQIVFRMKPYSAKLHSKLRYLKTIFSRIGFIKQTIDEPTYSKIPEIRRSMGSNFLDDLRGRPATSSRCLHTNDTIALFRTVFSSTMQPNWKNKQHKVILNTFHLICISFRSLQRGGFDVFSWQPYVSFVNVNITN